jgi:hypothetical protein
MNWDDLGDALDTLLYAALMAAFVAWIIFAPPDLHPPSPWEL